jgi:hypothetical protein
VFIGYAAARATEAITGRLTGLADYGWLHCDLMLRDAPSSGVQTIVPGTIVPRFRRVSLILRRVSSVWRDPRRAWRIASRTCGGLALPRRAAAIFALRWGSRDLRTPRPRIACPSGGLRAGPPPSSPSAGGNPASPMS